MQLLGYRAKLAQLQPPYTSLLKALKVKAKQESKQFYNSHSCCILLMLAAAVNHSTKGKGLILAIAV